MDEHNDILEIINVYIKYFNTYHNTNTNLFTNIDHNDLTSTNVQLEKLYEHIYLYNNTEQIYRKIINPSEIDVKDIQDIYILIIDDHIISVCHLLFPLLEYVATKIDWKKINWKIIYHE